MDILKKIPKLKFSKIKMEGLEEIEELKIDYSKLEKKMKNDKIPVVFEPTKYRTIKEIFIKNTIKYSEKEFVLEKFDPKKKYETKTYNDFRNDVINLGTGLGNLMNLKGKRVVIIGQTTYHWYVSYMTMLCSEGIAVPVDKELPDNEFVNVVNRARADIVIYHGKKRELIEKTKEKLTTVKYFIEMNSNEEYNKGNKTIGIQRVIDEGKKIVEKGDETFLNIKIDPEEFKVLIFSSGTTSEAKGIMLCNRNLAENVNAVSAYVKLYPTDRFFSVLPLHHCYESTIGFLLPVACGSSIAVCEGLKHIVPNLKETHPTALLAVPL